MSDEVPPLESASPPSMDPVGRGGSTRVSKLLVMGLVGVLVILAVASVMILPKQFSKRPPVDPKEIAELQAETTALLDQVNRERVALGLQPREVAFEPIDAVAARLKKDSETMVALAASYQSMLGKKDDEITARNAEIIELEGKRQALAAENQRLTSEAKSVVTGGAAGNEAAAELERVMAERDAFAAQLETARRQLEANTPAVSKADYQDLKRQLDETRRAKEFFEARAKELEAAGE